ncbi:hypothetical protein GF389_04675 [Candidatus Dojkabacteria bacterium]|nr:hypothetical protein [Candidatus Dojkabacteria bacterium]
MNLDKNGLQKKVNEIAAEFGEITLGEMLAGGVVSEIYSAKLETPDGVNRNIVVKYTKPEIGMNHNFSKTDIENSFSKAPETHNLDVQIQEIITPRNPKIVKHFPEEKITLMENFNDDGFELLQNLILEDRLPKSAAKEMGKVLATLKNELRDKCSQLKQIEASRTQFDERFYELKALLYNGRMEMFNAIEEEFLNGDGHIVWTDGDQKNFAVNQDGNVLVFDLGRSVECDPDFMLPNLLGHLALFYLAGYIDGGIEFFQDVIEAYEKIQDKVDERKFVNYFTASLLHRGMAMRWIDQRIADKVGEDSMKNACMHFGDIVFDKDERVESVDRLFEVLDKVRKLALDGGYRRKEL